MKTAKGQAALILILLAAGALIFYAITINWGRIAQEKALLTVAVSQGAAALASDAASYGEIAKVEYLNNTNEKKSIDLAIILIIIAIVVAIIICIVTYGSAGPASWAFVVAVIGAAMATAALILQYTVVDPTITSLWNKMEKNQPAQQQFFEQGIVTTLQGSTTDQIYLTDYFDSNANGLFGLNSNGAANDSLSRFAFYYTERLKMLNGTSGVPQIQTFYNQLQQFVNGPWATGGPLNDTCTADSNPGDANYSPYCDPCCQPYYGNPDPFFNPNNANPQAEHSSPYQILRPASCAPPVNPTACASDASAAGNCISACQTSCATSSDPNCLSSCQAGCPNIYNDPNCLIPAPECVTNNPYGAAYPYLYDPVFQNNYTSTGTSFLEQFGRDQQIVPSGSTLPLTVMTPDVVNSTLEFPNGIYPFFWLMNNYSPQVDNIQYSTVTDPANSQQLHWCSVGGAPAAPTGFSDLAQLSVPGCSGQNCCVNSLANSPSVASSYAPNLVIDLVGSTFASSNPSSNPAQDPSFGNVGTSNAGTTTSPATAWIPGDNQVCSATWPYNGSSTSIPDGTCELTNTVWTPSNSPVAITDPPETVDNLDNTMHTLSDFVNFAKAWLGEDVGSLTSTFNTWYPQVAEWIAPVCGTNCPSSSSWTSYANNSLTCNEGANGRLLSIYNPCTGADLLSQWTNVITKWLNTTYTGPSNAGVSPWCVPLQTDPSLNVAGVGPTAENNYIANNSGSGAWGDLGHVLACLNWNSNSQGSGAINNFQQCATALANAKTAGNCPASGSDLATALPLCSSVNLGRSLLAGQTEPPAWDGICGSTGIFSQWVSNSLTLAQSQGAKFALRYAFLNDIYTRAITMQTVFPQADTALQAFLSAGQQLMAARLAQATAGSGLPNSVIYGWIDKAPTSGGGCQSGSNKVGCAHIVKVTAYGPGRCGNPANGTGGICGNSLDNGASPTSKYIDSSLPWIKTALVCPIWGWGIVCYREYSLRDRDEYVYVKVQRWDQDHMNNALTFPNKLPLWTMSFQNPKTATPSSGALPLGWSDCMGLPALQGSSAGAGTGFGLTQQMFTGLQNYSSLTSKTSQPGSVLPIDATYLGQSFMLNDEGVGPNAGAVDPYAASTSPYSAQYQSCLQTVNNLLSTGIESHACAAYVATDYPNAQVSAQAPPSGFNWAFAVVNMPLGGGSSGGDPTHNYKIFFEPCPSTPPDDQTGSSGQ